MSPLLANIYLHTLDKYIESNYLDMSYHKREWRRHQGKANFLYVRYADDFVVLCNGTKAQAQTMKEELQAVLRQMGLELSEEKTKVTHIAEGFDFLGYRIIRSLGRKGQMAPKVLIPKKAIKKFQYKIRAILAPSTTHESASAKIQALNWLIRGWCEYYRCASGPSQTFGKLSNEIFWEMAHWLGRKYKRSMPAVMQKFREENTFRTSARKLIMPREYKAKLFVAKTWHNPYTETEKVKSEKARMQRESLFSYDKLWIGNDDRHERSDLRDDMMLLKGTICAIQGPDCRSQGKPLHPSEVEMDHIIPRTRFKDPQEADSMDNLQPLCTPCHRAKTKTDLKVLSRMP